MKSILYAKAIFERMVKEMNLDKTVCYCLNITNGDIKEAVENGARTLEEVQEKTGAGTACGACLDQIEVLVNHFTKEA